MQTKDYTFGERMRSHVINCKINLLDNEANVGLLIKKAEYLYYRNAVELFLF